MKVSLKGNKWIFKFDTTTISCAITKIDEVFNITFQLNKQLINIKTTDLDKTFLSLEKTLNSKTISSYR
jgi:hypothetical protein